MPVRSTSTPNRIGRTKPASPPARPTAPETAPMLSVKSFEMNLKTEALPMAMATPTTPISAVKASGDRPMWKSSGPRVLVTVNCVCG